MNYKRESDVSMAFAEAYAALRTARCEAGNAKLKHFQVKYREAEQKLLDWENLEASFCPDDVGFAEWITVLTQQKETAEAKVAQLERERHDTHERLIKLLIRAETAETALSEARERAIQECIKIADERVEWNKSAVVRFSAGDQKLMCDRASANAGEASRISEKLNALLAGASGAAGKGGAE